MSGEIQVATHEATPAIPDGPALSAETLEKVMVEGDLSKLSARQRIEWYRARCVAAGLDPRAQPFQYLSLQGKLVLYATKACSEQLTGIHKLSVALTARSHDRDAGIYTVDARATFPSGRSSDDTGVVSVAGLKGEALSNAIMKATTKAKRRAVLSACGLAMPDESEVDSIDGARPVSAANAHSFDRPPEMRPALPSNNTGHGSGAYAPPEDVQQYRVWLKSYVAECNAAWLDEHTDGDSGEVPHYVKELFPHPNQMANHLVKHFTELGELEAPEGDRAEATDRPYKLGAVVWMRDRAAVEAEAEAYYSRIWHGTLKRMKAAPPEAEDENQDVGREPGEDG